MKRTLLYLLILSLLSCTRNHTETQDHSVLNTTQHNMKNQGDEYSIKNSTKVNSDSLICWGNILNGLRLGFSLSDNNIINIYLKNESLSQIHVFSHVKANEIHLDPFVFLIKPQNETGSYKQVFLVADRLRSAPVFLFLKKEEVLIHKVNLSYWLKKNNVQIKSGPNDLKIQYTVNENSTDIWLGNLEAGPMIITLN
jgi:hypothetical protein